MVQKMSFRQTRRYNRDGSWETCQFEELQKGDHFSLHEGDTVIGYFTALSAPYPEEPKGNWGITTDHWRQT